ncbi:MAG: hypothetical protein RL263_179 [Bacteroidota bacterium]
MRIRILLLALLGIGSSIKAQTIEQVIVKPNCTDCSPKANVSAVLNELWKDSISKTPVVVYTRLDVTSAFWANEVLQKNDTDEVLNGQINQKLSFYDPENQDLWDWMKDLYRVKKEMYRGNRKIILMPDDTQERSIKTASQEFRLLHAGLSGADSTLPGVQAIKSVIRYIDLNYDKNGLNEESDDAEPYSDLSVSFDQINTLRQLATDTFDWMPELRRLQPLYASILYRDLLNHIGRSGADEDKYTTSILRFYEAKKRLVSDLISWRNRGSDVILISSNTDFFDTFTAQKPGFEVLSYQKIFKLFYPSEPAISKREILIDSNSWVLSWEIDTSFAVDYAYEEDEYDEGSSNSDESDLVSMGFGGSFLSMRPTWGQTIGTLNDAGIDQGRWLPNFGLEYWFSPNKMTLVDFGFQVNNAATTQIKFLNSNENVSQWVGQVGFTVGSNREKPIQIGVYQGFAFGNVTVAQKSLNKPAGLPYEFMKVDKVTNPFSAYQLALDASVQVWRIYIRGLAGYQFDFSDPRFRSGKEWVNAPETLNQRGWFYRVSAGILLMKGGNSK